MALFFKKSVVNSEEYEKLTKKLIDISSKLDMLDARVKALITDMDNLRGQFNKKLSKIKKDDMEEKTENINNPVILPYNGTF